MIFMNTALIQWLNKKQLTLETSVFGAEFVALKHGIEIAGFRLVLVQRLYLKREMGPRSGAPT
jgi:hypothetical protein